MNNKKIFLVCFLLCSSFLYINSVFARMNFRSKSRSRAQVIIEVHNDINYNQNDYVSAKIDLNGNGWRVAETDPIKFNKVNPKKRARSIYMYFNRKRIKSFIFYLMFFRKHLPILNACPNTTSDTEDHQILKTSIKAQDIPEDRSQLTLTYIVNITLDSIIVNCKIDYENYIPHDKKRRWCLLLSPLSPWLCHWW